MKLIGKNIIGKEIIVEVGEKEAARIKRQYAQAGITLRSYDRYVKREAKRLLSFTDEKSE